MASIFLPRSQTSRTEASRPCVQSQTRGSDLLPQGLCSLGAQGALWVAGLAQVELPTLATLVELALVPKLILKARELCSGQFGQPPGSFKLPARCRVRGSNWTRPIASLRAVRPAVEG